MSSYSLPSPRISGGSQRSSPDHRHFRLSASSRARVKPSGPSAKEPASNGAAQSPNRQQATSATWSNSGIEPDKDKGISSPGTYGASLMWPPNDGERQWNTMSDWTYR